MNLVLFITALVGMLSAFTVEVGAVAPVMDDAVPEANIARALEFPRMAASAAAFKNHALIVGGKLNTKALREVAAQNPVTWEWKPIAPLKIARAEFGLVEAGDRLYAVGGGGSGMNRGSRPSRSVERLTSLDGEWEFAPSLAYARRAHGVASLQNIIFACGGIGVKGVLASCELFIPGTDEWRPAGSLPEPRWNFGMAAVGGQIYAVGGSTTLASWSPSDDLLIRDPSGSWSRGPKLPKPLWNPAVVSFGGRLFVTTGFGAGGVPSDGGTFVFDPSIGRWQTSYAGHSLGFAAALAWLGQIYVLGGSRNFRTAEDAAFAFDPTTRQSGSSWVRMPSPSEQESDWIIEDGLVRMRGKGQRDRGKTHHKLRPTDVALVIGVERYRWAPTVRYAQDDAAAFFDSVKELGVPEARARLIVGKEASLPSIQKNIEEWLPSLAASDSRVIVYFAGAGTLNIKTGRRFLVPADGNPEFIDATGYPLERLFSSLLRLPAREILIVLDAGFSGTGERSIFPTGLRPLVPVRDKAPDPRITVITAGGNHDAVWSSAVLKGGAFTASLIEGIDGRGDADKDGSLTIQEVFDYTRRMVRKATASATSSQTPTLTTAHPDARLY